MGEKSGPKGNGLLLRGEIVRTERLRLGFTQEELGRTISRSPSWVSLIETNSAGRVNPKIAQRISDTLQIPLSALTTPTSVPTAPPAIPQPQSESPGAYIPGAGYFRSLRGVRGISNNQGATRISRVVELALELYEALDLTGRLSEVERELSEMSLERGFPAEAQYWAERAIQSGEDVAQPREQARAYRQLGRVLQVVGDPSAARAAMQASLAALGDMEDPLEDLDDPKELALTERALRQLSPKSEEITAFVPTKMQQMLEEEEHFSASQPYILVTDNDVTPQLLERMRQLVLQRKPDELVSQSLVIISDDGSSLTVALALLWNLEPPTLSLSSWSAPDGVSHFQQRKLILEAFATLSGGLFMDRAPDYLRHSDIGQVSKVAAVAASQREDDRTRGEQREEWPGYEKVNVYLKEITLWMEVPSKTLPGVFRDLNAAVQEPNLLVTTFGYPIGPLTITLVRPNADEG